MMDKVEISDDFRLALAIAIVKRRGQPAVANEEWHWRKKAKTYKQELNALRQQVENSEELDTLDKLPTLGPCDCLFLTAGQMIKVESAPFGNKEMSKYSVQLFLRNVRRLYRAKQRRRVGGTTGHQVFSRLVLSSLIPEVGASPAYNLKEHLASVLEFIMSSLCDAQTISKTKQFSTYVHHSVKFIKETIPKLLEEGGNEKNDVKGMVKGLTSGLSLKLLNFERERGHDNLNLMKLSAGLVESGPDARVWIQQTSYQLGSLPYLGHQFLFITSKLIAEVAESLVCFDPFHEGVAQTYENLYFLFQLFEKLLSDHLRQWANAGQLDVDILKDTLECHFSTVKFLASFQNWSSLVVHYNNRLTSEIIAQLDAIISINHCAEGSQHMALLHLVEMATSANLDI